MLSMFGGVVLCHPLTIASGGHISHPLFMFKIPAYGLADAAFERFEGMPIQLALDFLCIHGVAAIVAGTVFDECHELTVGNDWIVGPQFVQQAAERLYDLHVPFLVQSAD